MEEEEEGGGRKRDPISDSLDMIHGGRIKEKRACTGASVASHLAWSVPLSAYLGPASCAFTRHYSENPPKAGS